MQRKAVCLTIDELLGTEEAVWLFIKRADWNLLIPTAVKHINCGDDGEPYSIKFFSDNVQIVGGYGKYWWAMDKKPTPGQIAGLGGFLDERIVAGGKYNYWTAVECVRPKKYGKSEIWSCVCQCGRKRLLGDDRLLQYKYHKESHNGCGLCESVRYKDHPRIIVDGKRIPVFGAWCNMRKRCSDPKHALYKHYGGRGITVCEEWNNDFLSFYNYVSKLDHYGEPGRSLDRVDNDKGYFPGNVRWATAKEQANNQRKKQKRGKKDEQGTDGCEEKSHQEI